jgi:WD40 repeat protein
MRAMRGTALRALVVFVCLPSFACGGHNNGDDTTGATLELTPPAVELLILNGAAATQDYKAIVHYADGDTRDVTSETVFGIDGTFGTFSGATATVTTAGKTSVFGTYKDVTGMAEIIARVKSTRVDPSLPPNTPDVFNGPADPARAPTVVYPPADVVMPRNLGDFEAHWIDGNGNDVFELSLVTEFADVRVYVRGGNGVPAAGPMPSFTAFTAAEWASAVGLEPTASYQVRGVQLANPTSVGTAAPRLVNLTNEAMEGGIYYWAAANTLPDGTPGPYGIFRHDMSKPGQPAEEYMTTNQTSGRCVACHVLSRDGTKMAITYDGGNHQDPQNNARATMVDVATSTAQPDTQRWNFATFTPDGNQFLTVFDGVISVRNSADQVVLATMPTTGYVTHPDLSPDGARLVYVHTPAAGCCDWSFATGSIFTRTYDPVTHAFGPETPLVNDGSNNYYPSWSPDGQFILFNRAPGGDAYNNPNATLFVVKADGSAPPVQLAIANSGGALTNSWGRWAPFEQSLGANHEKLYWVTVSSKRDFGVRLVNAQRPQIWMTPFFPDRAAMSADPSAVAFRLPFQDITSNNHIAQWTERVVVTQ